MADLQVSIQFLIQQAADVIEGLQSVVGGLQDMGAKQITLAQKIADADEEANNRKMTSDQKLLTSRIKVYNQLEEIYRKEAAAMENQAAKEINAAVQRENRMQKEAEAIRASLKKEEDARAAAAGKMAGQSQVQFERELAAQINADNRKQAEAAKLYQAMLRDEKAFNDAKAKEEGQGFFAQLGKSLIGLTLFRQAIREVESVVREAFAAFEEYDTHLARINAISPMTTEQTQAFSRSLLDLATRLPIAVNDLAEAAQQYLRAGGDIANANSFVEQSGKLAVGTQSSMKASTELVIDTMKNYGVEMTRQGEVTDFFTALSVKSRVNLDELQNSFGRLTIVASNSGVSLEQLGAMFIELRESGLTTQQATVGLEQAINRLQNPTKNIRDQLKAWGVDATDLRGRLEQLKAAGLSEGDMLQLFGNRTGIRAIQPLLNGLDEIKKRELDLGNVTGETAKAFEAQSDTVAARVTLMKNAWQGFTDQALASLSVVLKPLLDILGGVARALEQMPTWLQGAITGLVGLEVAGVGVVLMLKSMGVALSFTGPVGLGIAVIGALAGAVLTLAGNEKKEAAERASMVNSITEQADRLRNLVTQYQNLSEKVKEAKKDSEEEAGAKRELKLVTDKLIEVHPEYKKALEDENIPMEKRLQLLDGIIEKEKQEIVQRRASLEATKVSLETDLAILEKAKNSKGPGAALDALGRGYLTGVTDGSAAGKVKEQIADLNRQMSMLDTTMDKMSGKAQETGTVIKALGTGGESTAQKTREAITEEEKRIRVLQDLIETMPRVTAEDKLNIQVRELEIAELRKVDQANKDLKQGRIDVAEHDREVSMAQVSYAQAVTRAKTESAAKEKEIIDKTLEEITVRENESFGKRRAAVVSYYDLRIERLRLAGATESQLLVAQAAKELALQQEAHQEKILSEQVFQKRLKEAEEEAGRHLNLDEQIALVKELGQKEIITAEAVDLLTKKLALQKEAAAGWKQGWADAIHGMDNQFKYMHQEAIKMFDGIEKASQRAARSVVLDSGSTKDKVKAFVKDMASTVIGEYIDMGVHQLFFAGLHKKNTAAQAKEATVASQAEVKGNTAASVSGMKVTASEQAKTLAMAEATAAASTQAGAMAELTASNITAAITGQIAAGATYFETYAGIPFVGPFLAAAAIAAMELEMVALDSSAVATGSFADGGIVTKPTLAMVGEGGEPEAITPVSALRSFLTDIKKTSSWANEPHASPSSVPSDQAAMGGGAHSNDPLVVQLALPSAVIMDTSHRGKSEFIQFLAEATAGALSGRLGRKVVGQAVKAGA